MYEKIAGTTGADHFRQVIKYKSAGLVVTKKRLSAVQNFVFFSKKEISQMQVGTARNQKRLNISNFTRDLRNSRLECLFVGKGLRLVSGFLILVFGLLVSLPVLANADSDNELTIRGTVRVGREVIPDVKVTVENAQNIQIGSEVTGEDGKWEIQYQDSANIPLLSLAHCLKVSLFEMGHPTELQSLLKSTDQKLSAFS